jgi:gliding motility-associated lipoprotein GldD
VKANGMDENVIVKDSAKVYGLMYDIGGNAATNLQFYVTDSVQHFMRGSLYFNVRPNIDSIQPVIDFLKVDLIHMLETFRWKESRIELKKSAPKKQHSLLK